MSRIVTIAAVQTLVHQDAGANVRRAMGLVRSAARRGAQIICLPHLHRTPYFPQYKKKDVRSLAETIPGDSTHAFREVAAELGVVIVAPLLEKPRAGRYYTSAVVINEKGKLLRTYRKLHLPHDPLFWEQNYFQPGDAGYRVYQPRFAAFAVLICYDQWFPEAARMATLAGAEIIFYPTAIGWIVGHRSADGDWHDAWETVMRGHAIANGVHVVAVNRVGREERLRFWGQSFACDSFGKILKRADASREEVMIAKLNLAHNQPIREGWGFLRNRRPEAYREEIRAA